MAAQTIPFVPNQSDWMDHQPHGLASAIPTALISNSFLFRSGLQHVLHGTPFVLAEAASATGSGRLSHLAPEPALVLIEAVQNTGRVLEVVRQVRERSPQARIVVLAVRFDLGFVLLGHEAGVDGFCGAACGPEVLIKSLELVMLGESVLPPAVLRSIMDGPSQDRAQPLQDNSIAQAKLSELKTCKLSSRETEILGCLREGAPNKVIARKLEITEATIKVHVKAILRKIGAANRTQAAMWATERLPRPVRAAVNV